ncbi:uncharacterized protein LOC112878132 [Panicum hallii]|uniref:uncharacterized protein LOC112878132 n=1 Tax=Panicum hallii TaxID=206008 RepID=UPI000DF4DB86|nr:uncharacterized protein LOC112878132 [Panicum hallii]
MAPRLVLRPAACCRAICHPNHAAACRRARTQASSELQPLCSPTPSRGPIRRGPERGEDRRRAPPTSALAAAAVTGGTGEELLRLASAVRGTVWLISELRYIKSIRSNLILFQLEVILMVNVVENSFSKI